MKKEENGVLKVTRRELAGLGAAAVVSAYAPWWARNASAEEQLVTEIPGNKDLLAGIQFVTKSEKEDQRCGNCLLYTAGEGGRGKCQIIAQGVVPEGGWCLSWAAKPA